jgi:hypothetical protein
MSKVNTPLTLRIAFLGTYPIKTKTLEHKYMTKSILSDIVQISPNHLENSLLSTNEKTDKLSYIQILE